jgi:drug/metabolite transporter (DMT)-like permease
MLFTTVLWFGILGVKERRFVRAAELRAALVPGILFGVNIALFFEGVTRTTVANAELIGALTPLIIVPAGAILFGERLDPRALSFGALSIVGLAIVLFNAPPNGIASWTGNLIVACAIVLWASYLLTSRRLRQTMDVVAIMTAIMPIATLAVLPITLARGEMFEVTARSVPYIVGLGLMTGIAAHGLMVFAQRTVPIGTIGILQVAQPALAVVWAYLLLDQGLRPIQIGGMALVIVGLVAVVAATQRAAPPLDTTDPAEFELAPVDRRIDTGPTDR